MKLTLLYLLVIAFIVGALAAPQAGDDCPRLCTLDYRPVCGVTAKGEVETFSNDCARKAKNCNPNNQNGHYEKQKDGAC